MIKILSRKGIIVLMLLGLLFTLAVPVAYAFEARGDEEAVVIEEAEVIEDDLYVGTGSLIVDGVIRGDLLVGAQNVIINGTVEGDLWAGGQSIEVNGTVQGDVRVGGTTLVLGPNAVVEEDIFFFGYSLETAQGSNVNGEIFVGGGQALLAGDVAGDVQVAAGGFSLQGNVGGNVLAEVGDPGEAPPFNPMSFMPDAPQTASIPTGLTIGDDATIGGNLEYQSPTPLGIRSDVAVGEILEELIIPTEEPVEVFDPVGLALDALRTFVALLIIGLLILWLAPYLLNSSANALGKKPLPSLGWGFLGLILVPVLVLVDIALLILIASILGLITLNFLAATITWIGIALLFGIIVLFLFTLFVLAQIIVGYWSGRAILSGSDSMVGPLVIGTLIVTILTSIPVVGGFIAIVIALFGLGALWVMRGLHSEETALST